MPEAQGRVRKAVTLAAVLACMLLALCSCTFALDPRLDLSQYSHTAWKISEGFTKGTIWTIAQTPDGYLWLGTDFGLYRFDGVRAVPWQPAPDQHLPSTLVMSLLAARDGTLWIGTDKGLASWNGGRLTQYPELAGQFVEALLEDHDHIVWVGTVTFPGRLCAIHNGSTRCYGENGELGRGVDSLYEDRKGNLWAGVKDGLWRWKPGSPEFLSQQGEFISKQHLVEDSDGTLLIIISGEIKRIVDRKIEPYPLAGSVRQLRANRMFRDRNGGLWIGTSTTGLAHVHQGRTDAFLRSDGLSGNDINDLFEDREGNVWVATENGLDRFRDLAVPIFSVNQGLSNAHVGSVFADRDGSVWLATAGGLNRWKNGQFTIPQTGSAKRDGKLNGLAPHALFQDGHGRIWASVTGGVGYLENGHFILSSIPGQNVFSFAEDAAGNLWMNDLDRGLLGLSARSELQQFPWASLGHKDFAGALAADPLQGGLWLGFYKGGIGYFRDGKLRALYSAADGLGAGRVNSLRMERDGTLWAATEGGLSRLKNGRIVTLTSKNGLPCATVHWTVEDDAHSFWLYTPCGLVRIAPAELDAWAAEVNKNKDAKHRIQVTVFDSSDGVRSPAAVGSAGPLATKSLDGKLWFTGLNGVSIVDPRHLYRNELPPPVHIEQIIADHKTYDLTADANGQVRLPPHIRDLQIDYTALSLVTPEKVLFRYKLEGWDHDWQDSGTRRQAFYSNLPPGNYTLRVIASNNSGVWNEAGAVLGFSVAPAYYQTWWFRSACVVAFLGLLAALYQLRLRQVARQFNMRLEERVNERTRIARDLHDTLLQSFQGVLLKFHAVTFVILDRPAEAKKTLEVVIDQARQAITEGRDAVQGLRSSTLATNELAQAISLLGEELTSHPKDNHYPDFRVQVEGTPRDLAPLLRDDIYRIACEAVRNAFRHAHAARIEVEICYDRRQLRVRVRDNGKGIDPKFLDGGGRAGHFGLPGMHERAKLVGGKLAIWSQLDSGTETELTIPASLAYAKSPAARWSRFWKRGA